MNIRNFLITTGATALVVLTFNVHATDALLSPRAAGNQIKHVAGLSNPVNASVLSTVLLSPRAAGNQIKIASGQTNVNPATLCSSHMAGGPKAIEVCAANPLAPMPCCAMAMNR